MRILLIRHANAIKKEKEVILSKKGEKQARLLAKRLVTMDIHKFYVSNYTRAQQTYEAYKHLDTQIPTEITAQLREIYRVIVGGPPRKGTPTEREKKDKKRAEEAWQKILAENEKGTIALICHGNLIRYYLAKTPQLKKQENLWEEVTIDDASISSIEIGEGNMQLESVNDTTHLNKEGEKTTKYHE